MKKKRDKRNIIVTEFWASHDECLHPICYLLKKKGYNITLAINKKLRNRLNKSLLEIVDEVVCFSFGHNLRGFIAQIEFYFYLLRSNASAVHINTMQGSTSWKFFLLPIPHTIRITGMLHHTLRLNELGQKLVTRRIDNYILLNDLMKKSYLSFTDKPYSVVYPIFYPPVTPGVISKPENELWIVVPGGVEQNRHDYFSLLPASKGIKYSPNIRFIILGRISTPDGKVFQKSVQESDVADNFIFFNEYIPETLFSAYVMVCDYIMPLIYPEKECYRKYVTEKVSGGYNLAFAYRKTMLCPVSMQEYEDFSDTSLFYNPADLVEFVNKLLPEKPKAPFSLSKWNEDEQLKRLSKIY